MSQFRFVVLAFTLGAVAIVHIFSTVYYSFSIDIATSGETHSHGVPRNVCGNVVYEPEAWVLGHRGAVDLALQLVTALLFVPSAVLTERFNRHAILAVSSTFHFK